MIVIIAILRVFTRSYFSLRPIFTRVERFTNKLDNTRRLNRNYGKGNW